MVSVSAVIFGVDGTILDTVDLHAAAWQQAFGRFGREIPREKLRNHVGKGADQLLPVFLSPEEIGWIGAGIASLHDRIYGRELLPGARVFPRVRELFERVARDGRRIVVASSLPRGELDESVERAGVGDLVSWAVSADDAGRSTPRPDVLEAALDRLGSVDPREVVLVGDTPSDAEAAAKLGVLTVGLLCGGFPEMELVEAGCAALYRDPEDLLARYDASPLAPRRERLAM
ncbi:HAD family hydrolase [Sorangium sp. So ce1078]|uniref:HAD family hydrolase n=1 Tax=Sorangium sp. So ce1078 TaxID=3133329 RepID=UPI003F61FA93